MRWFLCTVIILGISTGSIFAQEEKITITTYYPAPYGSYKELTAHRMKIGSTYSDSGTKVVNDSLIVEGMVGIGKPDPNPAYKLDVDGDVNVNGNIIISGNLIKDGEAYDNPDYVFDPDYRTLSLEELRKFVSENRHLPGMPSREEIKREGVKIFEQNRLLLEKLEEAYLYIFQLEERISRLERRLNPQ